MLFKSTKNWKDMLSPEAERELNQILNKAANHRGAYYSAQEVKIAQLWCALLESEKSKQRLEKRVDKLEFLLEGILGRARRMDLDKDMLLDSHGRY